MGAQKAASSASLGPMIPKNSFDFTKRKISVIACSCK